MAWANERRRYYVTSSHIFRVHNHNDPYEEAVGWRNSPATKKVGIIIHRILDTSQYYFLHELTKDDPCLSSKRKICGGFCVLQTRQNSSTVAVDFFNIMSHFTAIYRESTVSYKYSHVEIPTVTCTKILSLHKNCVHIWVEVMCAYYIIWIHAYDLKLG